MGLKAKGVEAGVDLDSAILESLSPGTRVLETEIHGSSAWSETSKITAETESGKVQRFFLKEVSGDHGRAQLEGEFVGMSDLHRLMPDFAVKPVAWGKLREKTLDKKVEAEVNGVKTTTIIQIPVYFILLDYINFRVGRLPDPDKIAQRVAELHEKSESPTGQFGYHLTTYDGAKTQVLDWDPSWTSFFRKLLAEAYRHDVEINGVWRDLDRLYQRTLTHLIPRLVGALESEGRSVKPVLIHGDMWEGNIAVDKKTTDPWIFDAAVYYAHNEMEMGIWYAKRHQLSRGGYIDKYLSKIRTSEPKEERYDRIRLYSMKTNLMCSACTSRSDARQLIYDDLVYLIDKYVPWDENADEGTLQEAKESHPIETTDSNVVEKPQELTKSDTDANVNQPPAEVLPDAKYDLSSQVPGDPGETAGRETAEVVKESFTADTTENNTVETSQRPESSEPDIKNGPHSQSPNETPEEETAHVEEPWNLKKSGLDDVAEQSQADVLPDTKHGISSQVPDGTVQEARESLPVGTVEWSAVEDPQNPEKPNPVVKINPPWEYVLPLGKQNPSPTPRRKQHSAIPMFQRHGRRRSSARSKRAPPRRDNPSKATEET